MKERLKEALLKTKFGYRHYLRRRGFTRPKKKPYVPFYNAVLKTHYEWKDVLSQVEALRLPLHGDPPKNWDSLIALSLILQETDTRCKVLDAGGELYSVILPWLFLYGYTDLHCINIAFNEPAKLGPINYEYGDITKTRFGDETFDVITCLSVVEHGVDLELFFEEASRILKSNGLLIASTDYWDSGIDTDGKTAFGAPVHVFSREEILSALEVARRFHLEPITDFSLECQEKAVKWAEHDLDYTFMILSLRKKDCKSTEAKHCV